MIFKCFWFLIFFFFFFFLNLSVPKKLKNSIFEMPILTQTLNTNNVRTISAKSINLHTIGKLIEYSLKIFLAKAMFFLSVIARLLSKSRLVLWPTQRCKGWRSVKFLVKKQKNIENLLILLGKSFTYRLNMFWMVFQFFRFCIKFQ